MGVQHLKEHPKALSCGSCSVPAFPRVADTPLPSHGASCRLRAVSLCLKGAWQGRHGWQHPVPGCSSCVASRAMLAPALGYGSQLPWETLLSGTAGIYPAWLCPGTALGTGVSALPGTRRWPCAAPAQAPAGTRGTLRGARWVLTPPPAGVAGLGCGQDAAPSHRALPGSWSQRVAEPGHRPL